MDKIFASFVKKNKNFATEYIAKELADTSKMKTNDFDKIYHSLPCEKNLIDKLRKDVMAKLDNEKLTRAEYQQKLIEIDNTISELRKALYEDRRNAIRLFNDKFKQYLIEKYGDDNRRLMDVVYRKAYANGHSGGLHEIETEFDDLMDFADEIVKAIK